MLKYVATFATKPVWLPNLLTIIVVLDTVEDKKIACYRTGGVIPSCLGLFLSKSSGDIFKELINSYECMSNQK